VTLFEAEYAKAHETSALDRGSALSFEHTILCAFILFHESCSVVFEAATKAVNPRHKADCMSEECIITS
jgi:hypothetical protein